MWGEEERPAILPKTNGSGVMFCGRFGEEDLQQAKEPYPSIVLEAWRLLQYGADEEGCWTGECFMEKVKNVADIVDVKYGGSGYIVVWLFH